jgi:hypothetical protein
LDIRTGGSPVVIGYHIFNIDFYDSPVVMLYLGDPAGRPYITTRLTLHDENGGCVLLSF